jgi:hypothetical protein
MSDTKLIGICGYARHGKDVVAGILKQNYGYERIALADTLREAALAIDPYVQMYNGSCHCNQYVRLSEAVSEYGWDQVKAEVDGRRLLQRLGTEMGRNMFGEEFWVDQHWDKSIKFERVSVPDVRFPNEADYIKKHNGLLIRVHDPRKKDNKVGTTHASEQHVEMLPHDVYLTNDGSIADLSKKVVEAVQGFNMVA